MITVHHEIYNTLVKKKQLKEATSSRIVFSPLIKEEKRQGIPCISQRSNRVEASAVLAKRCWSERRLEAPEVQADSCPFPLSQNPTALKGASRHCGFVASPVAFMNFP